MTTWTQPAARNILARSTAVVPVTGGLSLPDRYAPTLWTQGSSGLDSTDFTTTVTGSTSDKPGFYYWSDDHLSEYEWPLTVNGSFYELALNESYAGTPVAPAGGFGSGAEDYYGDAWLCSTADTLVSTDPAPLLGISFVIGTSALGATTGASNSVVLPPDYSFTGCAVPSGISDAPYMMRSDGRVMTIYAGQTTNVEPAFTGPAWGLEAVGSTLYTLLPATSQVGSLALSESLAGTQSLLTAPIAFPSCFAVSSSGVIGVGGQQNNDLAYGFSGFSYAGGTVSLLAGINTANNTVQTLSATNRNYSVKQTLTGSGAPVAVAWTPNLEQLMTVDTTNNVVSVYGLTTGTLALSQSVSLTGGTAIAITPNSSEALVCQPSQNTITVLDNSSNTWSVGQSLAITDPLGIVLTSNTAGAAITGTGVSWLTYTSTAWSIASTSSLSYTPSAIVTDGLGGIYVIGNSGSTGYLSVFFGGVAVGGASWTGSANAILWWQGQIAIADNTSGTLRIFGLIGGQYQQVSTAAMPGTLLAIGMAVESIFLSNQTETYQCQYEQPYTLDRTVIGMVSVYSAGAWTTTMLAVGEKPTAMTFDSSNNLWVAILENTVYEITSSGIASTVVVNQNGKQPQNVPIGISDLLWSGGHLYASTCLAGGLVEVQ